MNIVATSNRIPAMSSSAIAKVVALQEVMHQHPQEQLHTDHVLHGGVYSRTILIKAGCVLAGALVKVPTTLTLFGDITVFANDESVRLTGYNVLPASGNRKQAFIAHEDTYLTMAFMTSATTIADAEKEFTDEADNLLSRHESSTNTINITGE
jgi:hypothetical protein